MLCRGRRGRRSTCPSFDNSAMDGYAVRAEDVATATPDAARWCSRSSATCRRARCGTRPRARHGPADHDRSPDPARRRRRRPSRVDRRRRGQGLDHPGPRARPRTSGGAARTSAPGELLVRAGTRLGAASDRRCSPRSAGTSCWARPRPRVVVLSTGCELRRARPAAGRGPDLRLQLFISPPPRARPAPPPFRVGDRARRPRALLGRSRTSWSGPTSWSPAAGSASAPTTWSRRC